MNTQEYENYNEAPVDEIDLQEARENGYKMTACERWEARMHEMGFGSKPANPRYQ